MTARLYGTLAAALTLTALAGCSGATTPETSESGGPSGVDASAIAQGQVTTGEALTPVDSVTWWGDYRPIYTLDPIKLADYPEQTVIPNICEPMLQVEPDYTIGAGAVAFSWKDETHAVLTLQDGVTFSDGSAVTAEDVAYSVGRNLDPEQLSNYYYALASLSSIDVTGDREVTLTLSQPDIGIEATLATLAGAIVQQSFTEKAGINFGSPQVGVLCTGPYALESYDGSSTLVMTRNENYWDQDRAALAQTFTFLFPADSTALANALISGEIDGALDLPASLMSSLDGASQGTVYLGSEGSTPINVDLLMTSQSGPLAKTDVRQALSLALDRAAIADKIFYGTADALYRVSGPGMWSYAEDKFDQAYAAAVTSPDVDTAKAMVSAAGVDGQTAVFAYPAGDPQSEQLATVVQQTAQAIGIAMELKALPVQQYGELFADPSKREGIDAMITKNYVELPDPLAMDRLYGSTGGGTNFSGYSNATVDESLAKAQATADEDARADHVLAAEAQLDKDLPSIPVVGQRAAVYISDELTGAPLTFSYTTSAWAARIGAK